MRPNNIFRPAVIQDQRFGGMLQLGGSGKLGATGAPVEHEGGIPGSLPMFRPEIRDDSSGGNLSDVIQRQFNGYSAEQIVEEHSVSNVTPSRLEEKMNMLHLRPHCHS